MQSKTRDRIRFAVLALLFVAMAVLEFFEFTYVNDEVQNGIINRTMPLVAGAVAVILLLVWNKSKLFGAPQGLLFLIPCLIIAINNFPFCSFFAGKSKLFHTSVTDFVLFAVYCIAIGMFEECAFRGVLFPIVAERFSKDRKGLQKTFVASSVLFGLAHLFNLLMGAGFGPTVLQVGYSTLIGGLCAFCLIKTHNVLLCAFVHAVYDFCGMMMAELGSGTVFDLPTGLMMGVVGVAVAAFVLWQIYKLKDSDAHALYKKLGFGLEKGLPDDNQSEEKIKEYENGRDEEHD